MSVNVVIKPLNENDKLMTIPEIAALMKLNYGVSDVNYCLEIGQTGQYTILFDFDKIGRGFEVWYENNSICLRLPLPTTSHDIDVFYALIEKICKKMGVYFFECEGETLALTDVFSHKDENKETSLGAIRHIANTIKNKEHDYMILFGALNPVFIGENEIAEIDFSLEGFDNFMHRLQNTDTFYCNPRFFKMGDGLLRGIYFIRDGVVTTLPLKAEYPYSKIEDIHSYLVQLPDENYIVYDTFLKAVPFADYYDAGHITIRLTEDMIQDIVNKYAVDIMTLEPVKGKYWGAIIDTGYRHSNKVGRFGLDVEEINGLNHLAVFIRWAKENSLLTNELLALCPELSGDNPDYRDIIKSHQVFRNMIRTGFFKEKAADFVRKFYKFTGNGYPRCVDIHAENYFGTEKYNCEEFKNEAYLFVPYDEDYYKGLSGYISKAWEEYNK